MLKDRHILLGVTGGIAVYKVVDLVSRLKKQGVTLDVIMTDSATKFVTPLTFQTMAQAVVHTDMFGLVNEMEVEHIALAQRPDRILIAPATANIIGKIANGIADDMLTTVVMASKAKIIFAPAMNTVMYENPLVQENICKLISLGHEFLNTGTGLLACGDYGAGKMAEPVEILDYLIRDFVDKDLLNKKIVITAGPTAEPLDPVRYISNHSSGKMGYSIAEEARNRGAEVVLISGPTSLEAPKDVELVKVNTTEEMFNAVGRYFDGADCLIKSAAPSDYRPLKVSQEKIKKQDNDTINIEFTKNVDIAYHYGNKKDKQIIVGFAAETENLLDYAKDKLKRKKFDFIVANDVSKEGAGFKHDTNIVTIIDKNLNENSYPMMKKSEVAKIIVDRVKKEMEAR